MTQQTKNLRLRRTQTLLREALIALIEERGFEALTIGEITERALVSRAAFYRNYQDKYDLVEQIFEEAKSDLLSAFPVRALGTKMPDQNRHFVASGIMARWTKGEDSCEQSSAGFQSIIPVSAYDLPVGCIFAILARVGRDAAQLGGTR